MTTQRKIIAATGVVAVLVVIVGAAFFVANRSEGGETTEMISVYFFNSGEGRLQAERRTLAQGDAHLQIATALQSFILGPDASALTGTWPLGAEIHQLFTNLTFDENILLADLCELYGALSPVDEVLFRAAFTLTMTSLPDIHGVKFRYDGTEAFESAASINNNPFISPARRTAQDFTLFFADETGEGLITETYHAGDVNVHARGQYILARLIEGQNAPGILPLIPPETHVRDVLHEPDSGIYVNLSAEFHNRFSGTPAQARLMLQSITHTMLANAGSNIPRRVFFLIDSERWDDFHGVTDFNLAFLPDETAILGFVPPEVYVEVEE